MLTGLLYRLRALLRRNAMERELEEELLFHLEQQVELHVRAGMGREQAVRQARRTLGGVEQAKENCRDARGMSLWDTTAQDVRYALRQMLRGPGFSAAIVLTIGLGVGATTALFTVANAVLLRPLPVRNAEELVTVARNPGRPFVLHSVADYQAIRDDVRDAYTGVAAFNSGNPVGFNTADAARSELPAVVSTAFVSGNYFAVLGVGASAGRVLAQADERPAEAGLPVVLSYEFWQRRMGGRMDALGRPVRLNGAIGTVAGVAQRGFTGALPGSVPDVYVPLRAFPAVLPTMRNNWNVPRREWLAVVARLRPGVSLSRAAAETDSVSTGRPRGRTVLLPSAHGLGPLSQFSEPLLILLSAAGLLLALACANVAGLLLARSLGRQREIALRLALGAGRARLVRQLLTESLLIALAGGVAGALAGTAGARTLVHFLPSDGPLPFSLDVSADWRVLAFAFAVTVATGLLFGLGPALRASRWDLANSIKAQRGAPFRAGIRVEPRRALVVTQVSLSLLLMVGVALLARSMAHLQALDLGYARGGILFVYVQPAQVGYEGRRATEFYARLRERVAALPGVRRTSLADFAPLDGGNDSGTVTSLGREAAVPVESNTVSDGYLNTLRIPLIAGRDLTAADSRPGAPPVALVSESLAHLLYPNENAVGQRLVFGDQAGDSDVLRIVGIVRDARYFGLREKPAPMVYTALDPQLNRLVLCVRTEGAPEQLISAVRAAVADIDPAVPVLEAATMTERLNRESAGLRLLTMLLGGFGAMALVLAAIGLHGVLACGVAERTREIGIRAALGARRGDAVARVLGDVWKLVAAGVAIGSMAALAAVRLLAGFLFGVQPLDTVSFAWAIGVLLAVAALAGCLPARRAGRVDPAVALRHD